MKEKDERKEEEGRRRRKRNNPYKPALVAAPALGDELASTGEELAEVNVIWNSILGAVEPPKTAAAATTTTTTADQASPTRNESRRMNAEEMS